MSFAREDHIVGICIRIAGHTPDADVVVREKHCPTEVTSNCFFPIFTDCVCRVRFQETVAEIAGQ
jgi:hypothetical protein